jgi:hypothetical protein
MLLYNIVKPTELKGKRIMCIRVTLDTVERELNTSTTPVLLACLHPDTDISSQVEVLEQVWKRFGKQVKVYLLCEAFTGAFGQTYGIEGTPTYLLLNQNTVLDRVLGQVDLNTLTASMYRTLSSIRPPARDSNCQA